MTEFNDELADILAKNNKQLLNDWAVELEGRIANASPQEMVVLKRRLRIIKDHIGSCDWMTDP